MATAKNQKRWRDRHRDEKRQLNVMAATDVHESLDMLVRTYSLSGKGDAVAFACFIGDRLMERADDNPDTARLLAELAEDYHRSR
ncbi:MAG: hypothetical protein HQ501_04775 [Rhodospirillales bacterium]|nr:hypothetical protein [Rhodospirillales bacterium]